jgi:proton-coupled amino acid transporter
LLLKTLLTRHGSASSARRSSALVARSVSPASALSSSFGGISKIKISQSEVATALSEHLVNREDLEDSTLENRRMSGMSGVGVVHESGSVAHALVGGSITHDIYQWRERMSGSEFAASRRRRNSEPDLNAAPHRRTPDSITASDLREPGVFRRYFVANRAAEQGRQPALITRNFIDFLVLYGI